MPSSINSALASWLAAGGSRIGEISITPHGSGWQLRHHSDSAADPASLKPLDSPEALREMAKWDAAGSCV